MRTRITLSGHVPLLAPLFSLMTLPTRAQEPEPATGENREFGVIDNSDDRRRIPVKEVAAIMKEIGYQSVTVSTEELEFDLAQFLDLLCGELKFNGPVFVQCSNIQAPTRETLEATHTKWQTLKHHCRVAPRAGKND